MRKLGLRGPDARDDRDYIWSVSKRITLPKKVNLLPRITRIENQLNRGSCVFQAATSITEYNRREPDETYTELSCLMGYYEGRVMDGTDPSIDSGTYCRTAVKVLYNIGVCKEDLWPYIPEKFSQKPPKNCYGDAKFRRIKSYHRVISSFDMRACLSAGKPFMLGIPLFNDFFSDDVAETGDVPMPWWFESIRGYHAVYCIGYDDKIGRFFLVNSWGKEWGYKGVFSLPYKYIEKYVVPFGMGDCWMVLR